MSNTERIDLDAIEKEAQAAALMPHWFNGGKGRFRLADVLALVRAVRAARALYPLTPREQWAGSLYKPVLYKLVDVAYPAHQEPFTEFNCALAPFEAPR